MTNVTYADFEAQKKENKINIIEPEEGYTRISNELLEAMLTAGLTQHQLLVVMAIIRKTYGYNKKIDWVSNWQISELTGLLPHKCSTAKSALLKRKILVSSGRFVGINQCLNEWKNKTCLNEMLPESGNQTNASPNEVQLSQLSHGNLPQSGNHLKSYPNQVNTKDNILKTYKLPIVPLAKKSKSFDPSSVELPSRLPKPTWDSWVQYRKEINKPIKSLMTVTQAIKLLGKCRDNGISRKKLSTPVSPMAGKDSSSRNNPHEPSKPSPTLSRIIFPARTTALPRYLIGRGIVYELQRRNHNRALKVGRPEYTT